jgi:2-aminoadipate transaminase
VNKFPFAKRMARMQRSTIREILKITKRADIISFAGGLPAPELFPVQAFESALAQALREDPIGCLQYDVTEGYPPLKEFLCGWLTQQGLACHPDQMMLTNGSQQALDLIGKVFLDPGDRVLAENPTYLGAIQAFNAYEARYATVPIDASGLLIDQAEKIIRKNEPKLAYLVPTFQNPSGITMSLERRKAFLKIAQRAKLPVIEDDPYGYLRFSGEAQPSLYSLAKGKGVIYLSTFSKILSPGIRMGFVLASPEIIHALVLAKQAGDLQPNSLLQRAVHCYGKSGHLDRHIPIIIESYRQRAGVMLSAMERYFPKEVRWVPPEGGMFVWCMLPKGISSTRLFKKAIAAKVAYVTGSVFHANGGGDDTLRLNFTNSTPEQIEEGIKRLGKVFSEAL